jgi:hypothetical protein
MRKILILGVVILTAPSVAGHAGKGENQIHTEG